MSTVISHYMHKVLDPAEREKALASAKKYLKPIKINIIAISGMSGIFGALLANEMKTGLILVRKTDDSSHSCFSWEGHVLETTDRWIIVDDLIDTGDTVRRIYRSIRHKEGFLGVYLFNNGKFITPDLDIMQAILDGANVRDWEEEKFGE